MPPGSSPPATPSAADGVLLDASPERGSPVSPNCPIRRRQLSGSSSASLHCRPLRTGRAPHDAYGSSLSKASCDTRCNRNYCRTFTLLMASHLTQHYATTPGSAHTQCCGVHLLSSCLNGSRHSLVKRDQTEVCPLSCEVILQPLSAPLQGGICFLCHPLPAAPTVFLTVYLPFPAALRAYPVPHAFPSVSDPFYSPVVLHP